MNKILTSWKCLRAIPALALFTCTFTASGQAKVTPAYIQEQVQRVNEYRLVLLQPTNAPAKQDSMARWQMAHLANLFQLHLDGKISVFGPANDPGISGVIIFNTKDDEEIKKHMSNDPFIKNNVMKYQVVKWFGIPGQTLKAAN